METSGSSTFAPKLSPVKKRLKNFSYQSIKILVKVLQIWGAFFKVSGYAISPSQYLYYF